jgi:hypothetical protein
VGAEYGDGAWRDLVQIFDEPRAFALELFHHVPIVYDLMSYVYRAAIAHQRTLYDIDRPHYTGAKTARLRKYYLHDGLIPRRLALWGVGLATLRRQRCRTSSGAIIREGFQRGQACGAKISSLLIASSPLRLSGCRACRDDLRLKGGGDEHARASFDLHGQT